MELVTERDMKDARKFIEHNGLPVDPEWEGLDHDLAQAIADGRRPDDTARR